MESKVCSRSQGQPPGARRRSMMLTARSKRSPVVDISATNVNDRAREWQSANSSADRGRCASILNDTRFSLRQKHRCTLGGYFRYQTAESQNGTNVIFIHLLAESTIMNGWMCPNRQIARGSPFPVIREDS